jgi:hypothetical protein
MDRIQISKSVSRFKRQNFAEDCESSDSLSTGHDENVGKVRKIVSEDQRSTISETAGRLGLSYGTCNRILVKALGHPADLREVCASVAQRRVEAKYFWTLKIWGPG